MTCKATVSHFAKYPIANPCRQTFFAVSRSKRPAGASSHLEDRLLNLPEKRVAGFGKVSPSQWRQLVPLSHRGLTRVPFHLCSAMSSDEYEIMTRCDAPPNDAGGSLFQHAANTFGGSSFRGVYGSPRGTQFRGGAPGGGTGVRAIDECVFSRKNILSLLIAMQPTTSEVCIVASSMRMFPITC